MAFGVPQCSLGDAGLLNPSLSKNGICCCSFSDKDTVATLVQTQSMRSFEQAVRRLSPRSLRGEFVAGLWGLVATPDG